jgi:hypothetical protein
MSPLIAFASSGESKSFVFKGQHTMNLDLRGEISHTEYRTETYQDTCYNSVLDHYETRCVDEPIDVCDSYAPNGLTEGITPGPSLPHEPGGGGGDSQPDPFPGGGGGGLTPGPSEPHEPDPGPSCHTEYRQSCSEEPVYVDEPYECTRTREIPYEVHDGDALNHVLFNFGAIPAGVMPNDTVTVSSSGKDINVNIQGNGPLLYNIAKTQVQNSKNGSLFETTTTVNVAIESITSVNAAVDGGMTGLTANTAAVSFIIGKVTHPEFLMVHLKMKQSVFLGSKTMIDRDLQLSELRLTNVGDKTRVDIYNSLIGTNLSGKTVKITAKVRLNVPSNIAKPGLISTAQPEQTIKVKL